MTDPPSHGGYSYGYDSLLIAAYQHSLHYRKRHFKEAHCVDNSMVKMHQVQQTSGIRFLQAVRSRLYSASVDEQRNCRIWSGLVQN